MASLVSLTGTVPSAAHAARWVADSQWSVSAELEGGGAQPSDIWTETLGGGVNFSRDTETLSTRVQSMLKLRHRSGDTGGRSADGGIAFSQSARTERDRYSIDAGLAADSTGDAAAGSADLLLGRGDRSSRNLTLGWSRQLDERLSTQVSWTASAVDYDARLTTATDYDERSTSASLNYALSETDQASLSWRHASYRPTDGNASSWSDSLRLGWTRRLSEAASASLSVGAFRSTSTRTTLALACPIAAAFCESGVENYIVVRGTRSSRSSGASFGADLNVGLDERTTLAARLSRDLQASGAGQLRSDLYSANLARAWGPLLSVGLGATESRSRSVDGESTASLRQRSLTASLTQTLSPDSSLNIGVEWRRTVPATVSHRLSVTYQSAGPALGR